MAGEMVNKKITAQPGKDERQKPVKIIRQGRAKDFIEEKKVGINVSNPQRLEKISKRAPGFRKRGKIVFRGKTKCPAQHLKSVIRARNMGVYFRD